MDGPQIDHNPNERRPGNGIYWILAVILAFLWTGTGIAFGFDWHQISLGAGSGIVLATWATEITGNKWSG